MSSPSSFRSSLRLRVFWLLSLRSLLLFLGPLSFLLRVLFWLLNLGVSRWPLTSLLRLWSGLLPLGWSLLLLSLLLMLLDLRSLLILLLPLLSQFLALWLWSRLIALDVPRSLSFPMSSFLPALPVLLKSLVRNRFIVPPVPVPIMVSVVSLPPGVDIKIKTGHTVIIPPAPVIIP